MSRPEISWSYSALSMYENCPRKYWAVKVAKKVSDLNKFNAKGDDEHRSFDFYLKGRAQLPDSLAKFQPMLASVKRAEGQLYSEYQMALDMNYVPCGFKEWDKAWLRAIADVLIVNGTKAKMLDWKTGKPKDDPDQMELAAVTIFQHFPQVQVVDWAFVFIHHGKTIPGITAREESTRIWNRFLPTVREMTESKRTDTWPARPNPLCGWCPYKECQYNTNKGD